MRIGLIGLSNSGKTTIFNALTRLEAPVSLFAGGQAKPNQAIIDVADERIDRLSEMYQPRKTIYSTIEFLDFRGVAKEAAKEALFSAEEMGFIRTADALALVVRNFPDEALEPATPLADIDKIIDELLISDLIIAENRLERIELAYKRGKKTTELQAEEKLLRQIAEHADQGHTIDELPLESEQEKRMRGFQFLTQKPRLVILNSDENSFGQNGEILDTIAKQEPVIEFAGKFEMELSRLNDPEEEQEFLTDMGIPESARARLTRLAYERVGYISFFTVGPDEVRAWSLHQGGTALDAAATIHTDLARGFIRAECFSYTDLIAHGSEKALREQGLIRLEGKTYIVQDGNILNIRFNV